MFTYYNRHPSVMWLDSPLTQWEKTGNMIYALSQEKLSKDKASGVTPRSLFTYLPRDIISMILQCEYEIKVYGSSLSPQTRLQKIICLDKSFHAINWPSLLSRTVAVQGFGLPSKAPKDFQAIFAGKDERVKERKLWQKIEKMGFAEGEVYRRIANLRMVQSLGLTASSLGADTRLLEDRMRQELFPRLQEIRINEALVRHLCGYLWHLEDPSQLVAPFAEFKFAKVTVLRIELPYAGFCHGNEGTRDDLTFYEMLKYTIPTYFPHLKYLYITGNLALPIVYTLTGGHNIFHIDCDSALGGAERIRMLLDNFFLRPVHWRRLHRNAGTTWIVRGIGSRLFPDHIGTVTRSDRRRLADKIKWMEDSKEAEKKIQGGPYGLKVVLEA